MQTSNQIKPVVGRIALRLPRFDKLTRSQGLDTDWQRAQAIGVEYTTLRRIRDGEMVPGERFIGKLLLWAQGLALTPAITFEDLFEVSQ